MKKVTQIYLSISPLLFLSFPSALSLLLLFYQPAVSRRVPSSVSLVVCLEERSLTWEWNIHHLEQYMIICVNVYLYFAFLKHWMIGFISDWPGLSPSPSRASAKLKSWHETLGEKKKNKKHKNHSFYADTIKQDTVQWFIANVEVRLSSLMFVLLMYDDTCHVYIDVLHSCQVLQW